MQKIKTNMYKDRKTSWNVFAGCLFNCKYCIPSFQRQLKRQKPMIDKNGRKRGCQLCYEYKPHIHPERLEKKYIDKLPLTYGDEFIWIGSSGDITFCPNNFMWKIIEKIKEMPERTFFFQTKNPAYYYQFTFPENVILGTTIETTYSELTKKVSKAPNPKNRFEFFKNLLHPRKSITIEPIMNFYLYDMIDWCVQINPERIYVGYDTKNCYLTEPDLNKTLLLIDELKLNLPDCKIKEKLIRPAWDEK